MGNKVFRGTRVITDSNYSDIKWVGKTKDGRAVSIELDNAINLDNIDWTLADKDEVVASVTYTATYAENDTTQDEPWNVTFVEGSTSGANKPSNILLGHGTFYIGETAVGLTKGGGQFTVERTYRNIEADGDFGPVKGRIVLDSSIAKLKMNLLEVISDNLTKIYPATNVIAATSGT